MKHKMLVNYLLLLKCMFKTTAFLMAISPFFFHFFVSFFRAIHITPSYSSLKSLKYLCLMYVCLNIYEKLSQLPFSICAGIDPSSLKCVDW